MRRAKPATIGTRLSLREGEKVTDIDRAYTVASRVDARRQTVDCKKFRDIHDLKAVFAANPRQLARNLLQQLALYATGTPVRFSDRRETEAMLDACAKKATASGTSCTR